MKTEQIEYRPSKQAQRDREYCQSKGESAHTPGPWRVQVAAGHISVVCDSQQVVKMIEFPQISIVKANARLIAAAPELLEACKAFVGQDNPPHGQPGHIDMVKAFQMATAAIAKAEGRSNE